MLNTGKDAEERKMAQSLWKASWWFLIKLNMQLQPRNCTPGHLFIPAK